jgi:predicted RNase H-like HicB family nuclease/uncharacterized damage-inducible protein DinB
MTRYLVYLETHSDGRCMAHVSGLPGCFVRAPTRDEVLRQLSDVIRAYHAWLRAHGEPVPPIEAGTVSTPDEPMDFEIAGESTGFGPFDRGNAAALFPPDREPITLEQMEHHFQLLAHTRADLLALLRDLPDDILDWQADPHSFTLRALLRHVGNAEEWYISRVVPPETLPPEWKHDERRSFEDEDRSFPGCVEVQQRHDAEHAAQIAAWREANLSRVFPSHRYWSTGPALADSPESTPYQWAVIYVDHDREHAHSLRKP